MKDYLRFYAAGKVVRQMGGYRKDLAAYIASAFPHIYKLVDFVTPPREPIMILCWHVSPDSKKHRLKCVIRGYEESARYHDTEIIIPDGDIAFLPDKDRSQPMCFMRLLEVGYHNIPLSEFLTMFGIAETEAQKEYDSTSFMV